MLMPKQPLTQIDFRQPTPFRKKRGSLQNQVSVCRHGRKNNLPASGNWKKKSGRENNIEQEWIICVHFWTDTG
jgi:hypothetical protein